MEQKPWPALTFQGFFLAICIGLMATGKANQYVQWSFVVLMVLAAVQVSTTSARFLWLYPGDRRTDPTTNAAHVDTWILKILILVAAFLLAVGLTDTPDLSFWIVVGPMAFGVAWDLLFAKRVLRSIESRVQKNIDRGEERKSRTVVIHIDQMLQRSEIAGLEENPPSSGMKLDEGGAD